MKHRGTDWDTLAERAMDLPPRDITEDYQDPVTAPSPADHWPPVTAGKQAFRIICITVVL